VNCERRQGDPGCDHGAAGDEHPAAVGSSYSMRRSSCAFSGCGPWGGSKARGSSSRRIDDGPLSGRTVGPTRSGDAPGTVGQGAGWVDGRPARPRHRSSSSAIGGRNVRLGCHIRSVAGVLMPRADNRRWNHGRQHYLAAQRTACIITISCTFQG